MIPFFSTTLYTGAMATGLGGGDISPLIGFPVTAIVYYLLARKVDVQKEWAMADHEQHILEVEAGRHERIGVPNDKDLVAEAISEGAMDPDKEAVGADPRLSAGHREEPASSLGVASKDWGGWSGSCSVAR